MGLPALPISNSKNNFMAKQILFSAQELRMALEHKECVIVDCRFVLEDPDAGFEDYLDSHIPGAVYWTRIFPGLCTPTWTTTFPAH
jgi:3-mercaptopyruvate sulfurtransferase SseA